MIEFARNTPLEVANWLRAQLAAMPNDPILRALATDERMSSLWAELGKWQSGPLALVTLAVHFSTPTILSILQRPPEERVSLSWPEYLLGVAADNFAMKLEYWSSAATELLGEPVDPLVERSRTPPSRFRHALCALRARQQRGVLRIPASRAAAPVRSSIGSPPSGQSAGTPTIVWPSTPETGEVIGRKIWLQ